MQGRFAISLVLILLVAGCCAPPFSAFDVAANAPASGGNGPRVINVDVRHTDGSQPAATLIVFWQIDLEKDDTSTVTLAAMGLRSTDGHFVARVPNDRMIGLAAATDRAHAEEWSLMPAGAGPDNVVLTTFDRHRNGTIDSRWGPAAASASRLSPFYFGNHPWDPNLLVFDPDPEINAAYTLRMSRIGANLTWTNGVDGVASLGLLLTHDETQEQNCSFQNSRDEFGPGTYTEPYDSTRSGAGFICLTPPDHRNASALYIGPGTDSAMVAPLGLPYTITFEAEFDRQSTIESLCEIYAGREVKVQRVDPRSGNLGRPRDANATDLDQSEDEEAWTGDTPGPGFLAVAGILAAAAVVVVRRRRDE